MAARIGIIHGWSDRSESFRFLQAFLTANGFKATDIRLSDYVSMDDDVRIQDVAKRMDAVLREAVATGELAASFDLIVHSTGGLVAREWATRYFEAGVPCPARRIVMLAPANFGSRLAALGKSMIGRVARGWGNWFQTGTEILRALELASPYQWDLARRDLLDPSGGGGGPYGRDSIWPFVIVGTRSYSSGLRQIVNENGSDGTVRAAAANLNAVGMTVDFAADPANPAIRPWTPRRDVAIPFAVLPDRDHSSIIRPDQASAAAPAVSDRLGALILRALRCDSDAEYAAIAEEWRWSSEGTAGLARDGAGLAAAFPADAPKTEELHQYFHIIVSVRDDHGQPVDDFFVEFFPPSVRSNDPAIYFHSEVVEHVHVNTVRPDLRAFYVDRNDLLENYYPKIARPEKRQVAASISAAQLGRNIRYFDSTRVGAQGELVVHRESEEQRAELPARLLRNTTHLIEIVIPRQPIPGVFKLA